MAGMPRGGKRVGAGRKPSDPNGESKTERIIGLTPTEKLMLLDRLEQIRREAEDRSQIEDPN